MHLKIVTLTRNAWYGELDAICTTQQKQSTKVDRAISLKVPKKK